jgi:hypothetical protein
MGERIQRKERRGKERRRKKASRSSLDLNQHYLDSYDESFDLSYPRKGGRC